MKVIILAAGQGTRLKPLTDHQPKCMVKVAGISIIERVLGVMTAGGIAEKDIYIVAGYQAQVLKQHLQNRKVNLIVNREFQTTNMVYSLMCARRLMEEDEDVIISYGDIIYTGEVFENLLYTEDDLSVIVDDGWYSYWKKRDDNPLGDAETLMFDEYHFLTEIGQKTEDIRKIQSQYIGLMRFKGTGLKDMLALCEEAKMRSDQGIPLWCTSRSYAGMYMTDLLQGLIDEGKRLKAVPINRGWYEIDCVKDLEIAQGELK